MACVGAGVSRPSERLWSSLSLPSGAIDAGVRLGESTRFRRLHRRFAEGCPLPTLALGGSSTAGHKIGRLSPQLYHARVAEWLRNLTGSDPLNSSLHNNAGTPAIGPEYAEKCLDTLMVGLPSLVFVEFAQNLQDSQSVLALERLLRRVLLLPSSPAVILLILPTWHSLHGSTRSSTAALVALAKHYGLASVDLQPILEQIDRLHLMRNWSTTSWAQCDDVVCRLEASPHPNPTGHELIAIAIERALRRSWQAKRPSNGSLSIPPPLLSRVQASDVNSVFTRRGWRTLQSSNRKSVPNYELDSALAGYVKSARGWSYVREGNELHPKPGYVANSTKQNELQLCYPLTRECTNEAACVGRVQLVAIGYLKSYDERMGRANVWGSGGCEINVNSETQLNGFSQERVSVRAKHACAPSRHTTRALSPLAATALQPCH
ncbi:MAG: hypothetical protein SGPRY_000585 [Prymnesium sp.]